ncbi:hypothetical protein [Moraxella oblonga]|uniref:hypothetical protein n=1 Tax=Moraxella oblonga TaxID=200413 RepID=UPI0008298763|nr:hypothetical protein [Moraxella oblonga]
MGGQKDIVDAKIAEWERVTEENDGQQKYIESQFALGCVYAMRGHYERSSVIFQKLRSLSSDFLLYAFCEIMKIISSTSDRGMNFELFADLLLYQSRVLDCLKIDFKSKYERKLAHYTIPDTVNKILIGSKFRLNNIYNMNDPVEGNVLLQYFNQDLCFNQEYKSIECTPFIACFTFNHDSLNQFRLYGKINQREATGVSVVLGEDFFDIRPTGTYSFVRVSEVIKDFNVTKDALDKFRSQNQQNKEDIEKLPVYRCIYIDPETGYIRLAQRDKITFYREFYQEFSKDGEMNKGTIAIKVESLWNDYQGFIQDIQDKIKNIFDNMYKIIENILNNTNDKNKKEVIELINLILLPIQYLVKHSAFQEEQECRMCYITSLNDDCVEMNFENKWLYINYQEPVKKHIKNVYIATGAREYYPFIVRLLDGDASKVQLSKNPFRTAG